ncbi:MAG: hypothetical protein R2728_05115 [Chitinophagales bacterium]
MKALNKKDRQNAIFKFSLIYAMTLLFLGFLFWQVTAVPQKVVGESVQGEDFKKLKTESEFLKEEIGRAVDYIESSMGSLGYVDEKLEFYYDALMKGGEQALLNKDVRNNKSVAKGIIDSMAYEIKNGYTVKELPLAEKATAEVSIDKSLKYFESIMRSFVSELDDRNEKNQHLVHYADDYFNCMNEVKKCCSGGGGDCSKQIVEAELRRSAHEKQIANQERELYDLKAQLLSLKDQTTCCKDLEDYKDAFGDCDLRRMALKTEIEKTEKKLTDIASTLGGIGDRGEARDLKDLATHLLEVRQQN